METRNEISPQPGFQTDFLSTTADIAIGGGAAGAGKTFAELLEALRFSSLAGFTAIFFRRTFKQLTNPGGLWDNSMDLYSLIPGAYPNKSSCRWTFDSGATVSMSGLEQESDIYNHQGGQYALIIFDELTHFTQKQFFYLLSRNRSMCGVRPYVRAGCNPDPDSWVAKLIEWWIDTETGFPIPERAGVLRYMHSSNDTIFWGSSYQEVIDQFPPEYWDQFAPSAPEDLIKSITFIPGKLKDNQKLMLADPGYIGNLMALPADEKARLLDGNWKIRTDGLCIFHYTAIRDLFTNFVTDRSLKCITCDAARFGRDLCVIAVWDGWTVVRLVIAKRSDERLIVDMIEKQRREWQIQKSNVLVDQDGVGGGTVKLGDYVGFSGGAAAIKDPGTRIKENYKNLKTQCYYRFADKVNAGCVALAISNESVIVVEESGTEMRGMKINIGKKSESVVDLIEKQFRAIKKLNPDKEGKKQINTKEDQKAILGVSPDFTDTFMMREYFDLKKLISTAQSWASNFQ